MRLFLTVALLTIPAVSRPGWAEDLPTVPAAVAKVQAKFAGTEKRLRAVAAKELDKLLDGVTDPDKGLALKAKIDAFTKDGTLPSLDEGELSRAATADTAKAVGEYRRLLWAAVLDAEREVDGTVADLLKARDFVGAKVAKDAAARFRRSPDFDQAVRKGLVFEGSDTGLFHYQKPRVEASKRLSGTVTLTVTEVDGDKVTFAAVLVNKVTDTAKGTYRTTLKGVIAPTNPNVVLLKSGSDAKVSYLFDPRTAPSKVTRTGGVVAGPAGGYFPPRSAGPALLFQPGGFVTLVVKLDDSADGYAVDRATGAWPYFGAFFLLSEKK